VLVVENVEECDDEEWKRTKKNSPKTLYAALNEIFFLSLIYVIVNVYGR
jgi:hypothetical protein